jgi:hypothetical protein
MCYCLLISIQFNPIHSNSIQNVESNFYAVSSVLPCTSIHNGCNPINPINPINPMGVQSNSIQQSVIIATSQQFHVSFYGIIKVFLRSISRRSICGLRGHDPMSFSDLGQRNTNQYCLMAFNMIAY